MKKGWMIIVCLLAVSTVKGQQKAVTETGEEVVLYDNGSWEYVNDEDRESREIPINPKKFKKSPDSSFLLKSSNFNVGFWLNPKLWSFKKSTENPEAEYELTLRNEDLYALVISEKIQIPLETMKGVAIENGKSVSPDIRIVKEEYRNVNGLEVLHLQMDGTVYGIEVSYYGYYFSNSNGTVQFLTYTSQNLLNEYKDECEDLLNGLVELP